jgi:hypothetical protein
MVWPLYLSRNLLWAVNWALREPNIYGPSLLTNLFLPLCGLLWTATLARGLDLRYTQMFTQARICSMESDDFQDAHAVVAISDELDLHLFAPREVSALVQDYLDECVARGFSSVRIIHGKGIGALRRTVHAILERHPAVREYALAGHDAGGWGATVVELGPT